ncbi:MAG: hypothetical protein HY757_02055 [Nitrospirae bacterium]|nr:hypothetical protein [Nitrospirota bacterium]
MKLKIYLIIIPFIIASAGSSVNAQSRETKDTSNSQPGRYQLFQGTYTSLDLRRHETSTHVGIFLLDSRTGNVKRYVNKIDEQGKYIETWLPTEISVEK